MLLVKIHLLIYASNARHAKSTGGGQYRDSTIIDGEAREVKPDQKKIEFKDVN
jgi:hypothetical protein